MADRDEQREREMAFGESLRARLAAARPKLEDLTKSREQEERATPADGSEHE
jgi:hypothetical protein